MHAVDFAAKKHSTQRRKDKEATPYINHPVGVAFILTNEAKVDDLAVLQINNFIFLHFKLICISNAEILKPEN